VAQKSALCICVCECEYVCVCVCVCVCVAGLPLHLPAQVPPLEKVIWDLCTHIGSKENEDVQHDRSRNTIS
jgi:hypothetical protein